MGRYEMTEANEGRTKAYCIPRADVLRTIFDCYDPRNAPGAAIYLPVIAGPPEGYRVKSVEYSPMHQCFVAMVWHPEFADIPITRQVPIEYAELGRRVIAVEPLNSKD